MKRLLTIGMFGTCGDSTFRQELLIPAYEARGISYFNPQVADWKPELAEVEAMHLASDQIILFPVLAETYGLGSLGEVGFSIAQAMRFDDRRDFVFLIDPVVSDELQAQDSKMAKESNRMRALQRQHILRMDLPNVYLVNSLLDMLAVSMRLYEAASLVSDLRERYNVERAK